MLFIFCVDLWLLAAGLSCCVFSYLIWYCCEWRVLPDPLIVSFVGEKGVFLLCFSLVSNVCAVRRNLITLPFIVIGRRSAISSLVLSKCYPLWYI